MIEDLLIDAIEELETDLLAQDEVIAQLVTELANTKQMLADAQKVD